MRQATEIELAARFAVLTDVVNAYAQWQTSQKVVGSINRAISTRRSSPSTSAGTSTSAAPAACSICSTPSGPIRDTQLGYRQALADYMTSVQQINFAVGKQVMP